MGTAFDTFMQTYKTLKAPESWRQIIEQGRKTLRHGELEAHEAWQIYIILVSNYFYLRKYEETAEPYQEAEEAVNEAMLLVDKQNDKEWANTLYLASAVQRALCLHVSDPEAQDRHRGHAMNYIQQALTLCDKIDNMTAGKVYFNASALEHDVYKNFKQAASYYQQAISSYQQAEAMDDLERTQIRYIRTFLDEGKPLMAQQEAKQLTIDSNTKTGVQCLLLKAKIELQLDHLANAFWFATQGLSNAQTKKMQTESNEFAQLIGQIEKINPDIEKVVAQINFASGDLELSA